MPGVDAAGVTSNIALSGFESPSTVSAAGRADANEATVVPSVVAVTPGYFEAMATPLVRGRYFAETDRENTLRVAIVDQQLAGRLWPGEDPLGKGLFRGEAGPFTVVGVVRQVRLEGLTGSIDAIGTAYFPQTQAPPMRRLRWIAIKSSVDPAAVVRGLRAAVMEVDPDLPIADVQTMSERTAQTLAAATPRDEPGDAVCGSGALSLAAGHLRRPRKSRGAPHGVKSAFVSPSAEERSHRISFDTRRRRCADWRRAFLRGDRRDRHGQCAEGADLQRPADRSGSSRRGCPRDRAGRAAGLPCAGAACDARQSSGGPGGAIEPTDSQSATRQSISARPHISGSAPTRSRRSRQSCASNEAPDRAR